MNTHEKLYALLLSSQGQEKKQLVRSLKGFQEVIAFKNFSIYSNNKYTLVNHKGLSISKSNIQNSFSQLHAFFNQEIENKIVRIFFVVKFDRIDNMINSVLDLFVKFKKYEKIITVIITNFDQSQNKKLDLSSLQNEFFRFFNIKSYILQEKNDISQQIVNICDQNKSHSLQLTHCELNLQPKGINLELMDDLQGALRNYQKNNQENQQQMKVQYVSQSVQTTISQQSQYTQCELLVDNYPKYQIRDIQQEQKCQNLSYSNAEKEQPIPPMKNIVQQSNKSGPQLGGLNQEQSSRQGPIIQGKTEYQVQIQQKQQAILNQNQKQENYHKKN